MTRLHRYGILAGAAAAVLGGVTTNGETQSLTERIASARDGDVRMTYAAREGVCVQTHEGQWVVRRARGGEWESDCIAQPVRLALTVEGGRVTDLRHYVGGRWSNGAAADLGTIAAPEAADYLVRLARTADERVAERAISAAALAEGAQIWRPLLAIARDGTRPTRVRRSATFWVAHEAGDRITAELGAIAANDTLDLELREHAVFALSRRPRDEAVPALIEIVRGRAHPRIRQRALFWLGQSRDERALRLFEELLTGG